VVVIVGIVGGVVGLASGSGFGQAGFVLAAYAGWRIGWTGYRLELVGGDVVWRAPMVRLSYPRSDVHGLRSGVFDLDITSIEVGVDEALPFGAARVSRPSSTTSVPRRADLMVRFIPDQPGVEVALKWAAYLPLHGTAAT